MFDVWFLFIGLQKIYTMITIYTLIGRVQGTQACALGPL